MCQKCKLWKYKYYCQIDTNWQIKFPIHIRSNFISRFFFKPTVHIGWFKMIVDKYGNYVRKFMWQLCGWGIVDICITFHRRAFTSRSLWWPGWQLSKIPLWTRIEPTFSLFLVNHSVYHSILDHSVSYIGWFKMIVRKYGDYVRKFMWQLCGWGRVDNCMTFHKRAFNFFYHCTLTWRY
jgi:hypothetical protein